MRLYYGEIQAAKKAIQLRLNRLSIMWLRGQDGYETDDLGTLSLCQMYKICFKSMYKLDFSVKGRLEARYINDRDKTEGVARG